MWTCVAGRYEASRNRVQFETEEVNRFQAGLNFVGFSTTPRIEVKESGFESRRTVHWYIFKSNKVELLKILLIVSCVKAVVTV